MTAACKALAAALAGALALALNGCAGVATVALAERLGDQSDNSGDATGARPAQILRTQKFATDQPVVLEQIGVHYAYALGLSGDGVRIGIDDDFVDFTQRDEFEGRVEREASAGARLADNGGTLHTEILEEIEQCRERVLCEQWIQTVPLGTKYDITLEYTRDWMVATYDSAGEEEIENAIVEELVGFGLHEYLNLRHAILETPKPEHGRRERRSRHAPGGERRPHRRSESVGDGAEPLHRDAPNEAAAHPCRGRSARNRGARGRPLPR